MSLIDENSGTLNDANVFDILTPTTMSCVANVFFNITNLLNAGDDFNLETSVGIPVIFFNITSDGVDLFIDTGDGVPTKTVLGRIDINGIVIQPGQQLRLDYTKNSAADRDIDYGVVFEI